MDMKPWHWNGSRKAALIFAALFGCGMGLIFASNIFEHDGEYYALILLLWGTTGAIAAAMGSYVIQILRNRPD